MIGEREIVIAHDPNAGPVTAVKNVLLQSSLGQLQQNGYYDRYKQLIQPRTLEQLESSLGPGWIPVELADAHYAACDKLNLTNDEILNLGNRVGARVQETALVSAAKTAPTSGFDLWTEHIRPLHRVWGRVYQGGSVQVVKLGERVMQTEFRGFGMSRHRYYRTATLSAMAAAHAAMGARIESMKVISYDAATGEFVVRMGWA
jgi:hypothetical protein